jgi:hypothetical protein
MSILQQDVLEKELGTKDVDVLLITQDTYNEFKLVQTTKEIGVYICYAVAVQLAIIGFGRKTYGKVKFENEEIDILEFFNKNKINYNYQFGDKITPEELTPRRLIRLYRYKILEYLNKNKERSSYLYRKYCNFKTDLLRQWIFPGAEHLFLPEQPSIKEILQGFIETYKTLDERNNTKIYDRIKRVLYARGFTPIYIQEIENNIKVNEILNK